LIKINSILIVSLRAVDSQCNFIIFFDLNKMFVLSYCNTSTLIVPSMLHSSKEDLPDLFGNLHATILF